MSDTVSADTEDQTEIPTGPVTVLEQPRTALVGKEAFRLPETPTKADFYRLAAWVEERGGSAPFMNDDGVLVISNYIDEETGELDGNRYYTFVGADTLVVHNPDVGEFGDHSPHGYDFEQITGAQS